MEAERQLNNTDFYEVINAKTTSSDSREVKKTINNFIQSGALPGKATSLIVKEPREPSFYMLPKIHKLDTPGRPIVSACSCPTELVSEFVDSILQPLVKNLPSYVKDSSDALRCIENFGFTENQPLHERRLFTMDVSSLYTNIPHNEGLNAVKHFLSLSSYH